VTGLAACGGSREGHEVFATGSPITATWHANAGELLDLGVPALHNVSNKTVRLTSARLVNPPAGLVTDSIHAYSYAEVGNGVISQIGDLPHDCSKYIPHPLADAVTPPHADSAWYVVIAFRVPKPGRYHFTRIRIDYIAGNKRSWQYEDLDTTLVLGPPLGHLVHAACNRPPATP
jgi:hypothetical protein